MTVLVTGGHGQLGRELADLLSAQGLPSWAPGHGEMDVTDHRAVAAALDGVSLVINAASMTDVDRCESDTELARAANSAAAENLAVACDARAIPLVQVSTDFVFDGRKGAPYETTDAPAPLSVYGTSKLTGEQAVRRLTRRHYIVRTSWLYGVYGKNFPKAILGAAAAGRSLRVVDDQVGSPTHARDLAKILLRLAGLTGEAPAPYGLYHAANGGSCSRFEFAQEILAQASWRLPVEPISSAELNRPAPRPNYSVLSLSSIEGLGIEPVDWRRGLADFMARLRPMQPELFPVGGD